MGSFILLHVLYALQLHTAALPSVFTCIPCDWCFHMLSAKITSEFYHHFVTYEAVKRRLWLPSYTLYNICLLYAASCSPSQYGTMFQSWWIQYDLEITGSSNSYAFQRSCLYYFNLWNSTKRYGPTVIRNTHSYWQRFYVINKKLQHRLQCR